MNLKEIFKIFAEDGPSAVTGKGTEDTPGHKLTKVGLTGDEKVDNNLTTHITIILNAIIGVLGLVCVVVMIVGGINYMTSGGDSSKVEKGKKTILYGAIGLIICVLAFAIVNFVIGDILNNA